jgi:hypothetical protein
MPRGTIIRDSRRFRIVLCWVILIPIASATFYAVNRQAHNGSPAEPSFLLLTDYPAALLVDFLVHCGIVGEVGTLYNWHLKLGAYVVWWVALGASIGLLHCKVRQRTLPLRRKRLGECVVCGYSLHGLTERRCPECGTAFDKPPLERRSRI